MIGLTNIKSFFLQPNHLHVENTSREIQFRHDPMLCFRISAVNASVDTLNKA